MPIYSNPTLNFQIQLSLVIWNIKIIKSYLKAISIERKKLKENFFMNTHDIRKQKNL